ncbi:hypothetical protein B0H19DRAFT_1273725 [Mycena capillaripes]|nr:hypothetical protein B0H19DRAFT_1273725 [Mycena capillaripes]
MDWGFARVSSLVAVRGQSWKSWKKAGRRRVRYRSERVRGRTVPYALGGLLGTKSYNAEEACCDSWSVSSSAVLGFAPRNRVALRRPEAEEAEVELEVLVVYEAEEDAALGGRSTESDLERSCWAGDWRKRGSFEAAVGDVGELANGGAGVGG